MALSCRNVAAMSLLNVNAKLSTDVGETFISNELATSTTYYLKLSFPCIYIQVTSSDNKESLFGIDFDINTTINIEVKLQKSRAVIKPGDKCPVLFKGMTTKDFSSWNLRHL